MEPAIDDEAAFGEPLDHIGIAEPVAHVPADGHGTDIVGEAML